MWIEVVIIAITAAIGIFLLTGKGSFLVRGSKSGKDRYDLVALSKFQGKVVLGIAVCILIWAMQGWLNIKQLGDVAMCGFVLVLGGALLYMKTGIRFRKQ